MVAIGQQNNVVKLNELRGSELLKWHLKMYAYRIYSMW